MMAMFLICIMGGKGTSIQQDGEALAILFEKLNRFLFSLIKILN
jgi:hypothetical protein